jgi:hypothetical protein
MTTTEKRSTQAPARSPRVRAAAAARASIRLYEYDKKPVPQWLS